jgi:hypothetical protein
MQLTLVTKADVVVSFVSENLSLGTFLAAAFRHGDRAQTLKLRCRDLAFRPRTLRRFELRKTHVDHRWASSFASEMGQRTSCQMSMLVSQTMPCQYPLHFSDHLKRT